MLKENPHMGAGFPIDAASDESCIESHSNTAPIKQPRQRIDGTLTMPNRKVDLTSDINALAAQQNHIAKRRANYNARRLRLIARGVRP